MAIIEQEYGITLDTAALAGGDPTWAAVDTGNKLGEEADAVTKFYQKKAAGKQQEK